MCVESRLWCDSGTCGLSAADGRCMKARRPERGGANQAGIHACAQRTDAALEPATEGHDQVVRVLIVDERRTLERLTRLEDLRRSEVLDGERLEREHRDQRERARTPASAKRRHQPVLRLDFVKIAELPALIVEPGKHVRIEPQAPLVDLRELALRVGGRRGRGRAFMPRVRRRLLRCLRERQRGCCQQTRARVKQVWHSGC